MTAPNVLVVDASVVVKWYIPEPQSREAALLLDGDDDLVAPDLVVPELGNVLWKKAQRGEIGGTEASGVAEAFALRCPLRLVSSLLYLPAALDVALRFRRSVYDALYVAVAVTLGGRCVTADKHLVNALAGSELAGHLWLLGANW